MATLAKGISVYRPDLGTYVIGYYDAMGGYIGYRIMPLFFVDFQSSGFPVIPLKVLLSVPDTKRAPKGAYPRGDWQYEYGFYATTEKGWEEPVDDVERKLLDARVPGLADRIATQRAMGIILRAAEVRIAAKIFNPTYFTPHALANPWDDIANATPIDDVRDGRLSMFNATGLMPDALVITFHTFEHLKNVDQIVNRLKYTFPGLDINKMNSVQLAAVFDIPEVIIASAPKNSADKGQVAKITTIWNKKYAALVKISNGPDLTIPGVGRTFLWTEDSPSNPVVETYREEKTRGDIVRVRHHCDEAYIRSVKDDGTTMSDIAQSCVYLLDGVSTPE